MSRARRHRVATGVHTFHAAACLLFALVCCSVAPKASAQSRPLWLWHAYDGAERRALEQAVDLFERETGEEVQVLSVPFGAYLSKLESSIPTGTGPDVFVDAHERLQNYASARLLAPVEAPDQSLPERVTRCLVSDGVAYGVPLAYKAAALYLNRSLVPEPPSSLDSLFASVARQDGTYPLVFETENAYYVAALLHAEGGQMLTDEGEYAFVGEAAERTLALLASYQREGFLPEETNGELVQSFFSSGRAAAAISGPWLAPNLPDDLNWYVVPLPPIHDGGAPMRPFLTVEAAFVSAESEHPRAQDLARFLAGDEASAIRANVGGQIVVANIEDTSRRAPFRAAAEQALPMPTNPHMRLVFEPAQGALRRTLRGGEAPGPALESGAASFANFVRPLPSETGSSPYLLALGLLMLLGTGLAVRRARTPEFKTAFRESLPAYRYLAHAALAVGLLVLLPLAVGAATSLFSGRGRDLYFVGFANYIDILSARGGDLLATGSFYAVLGVTVLWTMTNLALHLGIGVALALMLSRQGLRFRGIYRVLLILPWAVPSYVTALAWKGMFHRQLGAINAMLEALGAEPVSWFAQFSTAFSANLITNVWLGFPFMMVVTLGALTSIPSDLYEAADVDGASRWQKFRMVTLPLLVPSLAPAVAMGAVWTFNMFNVVFLVSGGEPGGSTEILVSEAYRWAFTRSNQYGYAAAYAVLIFVVLTVGTRLVSARSARV